MQHHKVKRFHQMVRLVKGPVNTAIIDLQTNHIYQVENSGIEALENKQYDDIAEFIRALEDEKLIIEVPENTWIPAIDFDPIDFHDQYSLEIEEGADLNLIRQIFRYEKISAVFFYGSGPLPSIIPMIDTVRKEKNLDCCKELSIPNRDRNKITYSFYQFNRYYNSCWGNTIVITKDNKVRPCIHSGIVTGQLGDDDFNDIMEKANEYWIINKDKIAVCKACEFRYTCFDCREMARRANGDLLAKNPFCTYDPFSD